MTDDRMKKFETRREALKKMSDEELKTRFWELCNKVAAPLAELSRTHTSPSIERSVLMRMGIDTFTAQAVVAKVHEAGLLGKGAGHAVLKVSQKQNVDLRTAAKKITESPDILKNLFA